LFLNPVSFHVTIVRTESDAVLDRPLISFTPGCLPHLPFCLIIIDKTPFVSFFPAPGKGQLNLDESASEVQPERDKRNSTPRCPTDEAADFCSVQE